MKKKRKTHYSNYGTSKVGDSCRNCNNSSTSDYSKNKSTITDNEYEVNSESNSMNAKNKRSK